MSVQSRGRPNPTKYIKILEARVGFELHVPTGPTQVIDFPYSYNR
jgi:hypothetical protein